MQTHQEPLGKVSPIFQSIVFQPLKVVQASLAGKLGAIGKITLNVFFQPNPYFLP